MRGLLKKKWTRIGLATLVVVGAAVWFLRPTPPAPAPLSDEPMQAVLYHEYGPPEVLQLETTRRPLPKDDQVVIKVRAAAANPLDWHYIRGTPYLMRLMGSGLRRPEDPRIGTDVSGIVTVVGKNVTQLKVGDEVFGAVGGAYAEYARASVKNLVLKPANVSFEEAAGVPVAAITALQAARDKGQIKPGQKVLVNGASGGVGTFAVQIAKSLGAEVTGVCSTRNIEMVRSLGADHVIDYTKEDFTEGAEHYDVILDNVGNHSLSAFRRALTPTGIYVGIGGGGPDEQGVVGPLWRPLKAMSYALFVKQKFGFLFADITQADLQVLREMLATGKLRSVIDRTFELQQVPDAMRYLETGRARGKIIVVVDQNEAASRNST